MRDARRSQVIDRPRVTGKNPTLAAMLPAVIVGVGQFYNGDMKKGALMLLGAVILGTATAGLAWLALAIWSAWDAYRRRRARGFHERLSRVRAGSPRAK
jgi:TM2 domain-containing membrane protein YozV